RARARRACRVGLRGRLRRKRLGTDTRRGVRSLRPRVESGVRKGTSRASASQHVLHDAARAWGWSRMSRAGPKLCPTYRQDAGIAVRRTELQLGRKKKPAWTCSRRARHAGTLEEGASCYLAEPILARL